MRLTVLQVLLIVLVSGVVTARPTTAYGQSVLDEIISVNTQGKKIKQILLDIEKSVGIKFTYNPQTISVNEEVSVEYNDEKLSDVLKGIFVPRDVQFRLLGDYIILTKQSVKSAVERVEQASISKLAETMTGTVSDEDGMGLPGVSVTIKGTLIGTVTDADGKYSLAGVSKGSILVFSFIGYKTEEVSVLEQASVDLKMVTDVSALNEVVIVGYGTQKEYTSAGAISSVNVQKQLQYGTTRSMSNNLAGQVAGIIGVQRSGEPGYDDSNFWIRGISTFAGASRAPLVLVDGVERSLNTIDPAEIESVSVLKDASASAVYGVRGANGVVLINTKRGDVGKPTIVLRYEQGVTSPVKLPKFLGAADYMELMNEISVDQGKLPINSEERINNTRNKVDPDLYPDVNWLDAITNKNASNSRINLTASGGTNFLRYAITGSHYSESGIVARDPNQEWDSSMKLKRYNIRSNVDLNVTPTTLLRVNIGGYLQETTRPPQSMDFLFDQAFQTAPYVHPTEYSSGEIPRVNADRTNPWAVATQTGYARGSASKIESLFSVQQDMDAIIPGLTGRVLFSFDRYSANSVERKKDPDYYKPATGRDENGALMLDIDRFGQVFLNSETKLEFGDKSVYFEGSLNYSHNIGNHYLDGLLLYNQRNYDNGQKLPFRFQGMAARVSYSFKRKYIAEANFGYNGSENLAKNNRFGFFPSAALGWVVTEEEFMASIKDVVSRLKFRASLGQVGNDRFGDDRRFAYISTIGETDDYRWGVNNDFFRAGRQEGIKGVSNLTWETVTKGNLGMELGFWNSVLLQVDFFKEERKDIFMQRQTIPSSAGFVEKPNANYGKVQNHGVDLSLSANKQLSSDWFVSGQGTFTFAKNKIIEQDEAPAVIGTYRSRTSKSVDQNFGYVAERLYTNADFSNIEDGVLVSTLPRAELGPVRPGDIKYADLNGDGVINNIDQTTLTGTVDPQIVYGFGINARYKNIDFGFFFQGNTRTYRILGGDFFQPGSGGGAAGNVYETVLTDRWTIDNPNPDAFWPRASFQSAGNNNRASTWWLKDMSMLRLKHVEIGFSLPRTFIERAHAKSARIFISGNNLLTFSKFDLWDPEINTGNGFRYPIMKSFSAGINLEF